MASLFFCGKRKGEIQDARSVRPYCPDGFPRYKQRVFSGSRIGVRDDTVRIEDGMTGDRIEGGMTRELHWRTG